MNFNNMIENLLSSNYMSLEFLKSFVINLIKGRTFSVLHSTDWKIIRHRDQIDSGGGTSLTDQEYQDLLIDRENIRINSDIYEQQVNDATSIEQIKLIDIEY